MNTTTDQPDDFDDMLKELVGNWDELSSQMMSDQLPTTSFAMSALGDFGKLLAESTKELEILIRKKQKTAGGIQNTILPMRDKRYFKEFAASVGCVYIMSVLAKRWDDLKTLPPWLENS